MSKNNKIIGIILAALVLVAGTTVIINYLQAKDKLDLLSSQEIIVSAEGKEIERIGYSDLLEIGPVDFKAKLKSSTMIKSKEHNYTGVAVSDIFTHASISLEGKTQIIIESLDGYIVPLKIEEVLALENVYLVYKDNGEYLKAYKEPDGQGPYMIVVKGDNFSQRWAKYVTGISLE